MNKIDRYVLKSFVQTLLFAVIALCVIFLVVNLMESLDGFLDHKATAQAIAQYYLYFLPQIIKLIFPIAMLMASLFAIGKHSGANEITAMKTSGMSLYRLMTPIVILSALISFGQLYFNGWVVPRATTKMLAIDRKYLGKGGAVTETQVYNLYFRDTPLRNVVMSSYDEIQRSGAMMTVEDYAQEQQPRVLRRLDARLFRWDSTQSCWLLSQVFERSIDAKGEVSVNWHEQDTVRLLMSHSSIVSLQRTTDEMTLDELREYIAVLERGGKDVRMKRIDYFGQYAFPFADLIVVLFGVPFASIRKKGGIAVEIATAMTVSFVYLVFTKISQSLGFELNLSPISVAWSANALFLLVALANLYRTRT